MKTFAMFVSLFCILVSLVPLTHASANDLVFSTQEQIDDFQTDFPGTTCIQGNVTISGTDIFNLDGLNPLQKIDGTLLIEDNPLLEHLTGLSNLTDVWNLMIIDNNALTDLTGLEGLKSINGYVHIWYNDLISNFSGLDNLCWIGSDLMVEGNYALASCQGLERLTAVGGHLVIGCIAGWMHHHRSIKSLQGFDQLRSVGGMVWINCNDSITNLNGLESLVSIGAGLVINGNKSLKTLNGLEQLKACNGCLIIGDWWEDCDGNPKLTSLKGIEHIDPESISGIRIRGNESLSDCAITSVCGFLMGAEPDAVIYNNGLGCSSFFEVQKACAYFGVEEQIRSPWVSIHPNPARGGTITLNLTQSEQSLHLNLCCYDSRGSLVHKQVIPGGAKSVELNVEGWSPGVYVVVLLEQSQRLGSAKIKVQ